MSLSDDKQAYIIMVFNTTSRYLDGILNINNSFRNREGFSDGIPFFDSKT